MNVSEDLEIRLTRKYVGTYKHLDEHETIGSLRRIGTEVVNTDGPDDGDCTDSRRHTHHVIVEAPGRSDDEISQALHDMHTSWGCAHEYDCCGCRSYMTTGATRVTGDLWCVEVSSSRNF